MLRRQGWSDEKYLASRSLSARKLARYVVMASLRSSRAALIEHIEGTARAKELCKLEGYNRIGLCSDRLSEGENLQQAACVVRLDMPSLARIAEQRVGRVDRMDDPHREIEA